MASHNSCMEHDVFGQIWIYYWMDDFDGDISEQNWNPIFADTIFDKRSSNYGWNTYLQKNYS